MRQPAHRQRGITLLESLIAFLVLTLGMLAIARVQGQLRLNAETARHRSEAVRIAQDDIETLRAFGGLASAPGARSFEAIANATRTVETGEPSHTAYVVTRQIDAAGVLAAKNVVVTVRWNDRSGVTQQVTLASMIAGIAPAYSGELGLARDGSPVKGALGRSARIPLGAKDLGDGRSAFKPVGAGTVALVFDNVSGALTGRCGAVASSLSTSDLTAANLGSCDARAGHLLSGTVRFSSASPPDPARAGEAPPALSIALAMSGSYTAAPSCSAKPITSPTGDRFMAWHCAVYPQANGQWSGRVTVVPSGWTIGTTAADKHVCRYTADLDGSGAIDANIEHPSVYAGVYSSLANQAFLVIQGGEACPTGRTPRVAGNNGDVDVDLSTAPHQP